MSTPTSTLQSRGTPVAPSVRYRSRRLGFSTTSRLAMFMIFGGAMMFFSLERMKLHATRGYCPDPPDDDTVKGFKIPGECYWWGRGLERLAFLGHVWFIVPAGFLACLQFVPALQRPRYVRFHRVSGYVVLAMSLVGSAGAMHIGMYAVGGPLTHKIFNSVMGVVFVVELAMAYISIRRLRIDLHREWMLRAWILAGFIITMRLMMALVVRRIGGPGSNNYQEMDCKVIDYILKGSRERIMQLAPGCGPYVTGENPDQWTLVRANRVPDTSDPIGRTATLQIAFPRCAYAAALLHLVVAEAYIYLTSAESERLRLLSKLRHSLPELREKGLGDEAGTQLAASSQSVSSTCLKASRRLPSRGDAGDLGA